MPTPLIPGHEAAARLSRSARPSPTTASFPRSATAACSDCGRRPGQLRRRHGRHLAAYAEAINLYNFANIGAFVQETIVAENQCIPIPKEMPLTGAALIGCGVMTGTGAVFNRAQVQLGDTCVVIGAGGVGLNVIQAAKLVGARQIIAIDRIPEEGSPPNSAPTSSWPKTISTWSTL